VIHAYAHTRGLVGILVSDKEYPMRVSYALLSKALDEFMQIYPVSKWEDASVKMFLQEKRVCPFVLITLTGIVLT
jgi:synaptobrevin homolog YKT6